MNRNTMHSFDLAPHESMKRSKFNLSHSLKTSFNVGDCVPIFLEEVLPGDTFSIKTNDVVRLQTLLDPIMDDIYLDTYYFFVPNRLVWEHWINFMGENDQGAWTESQIVYSIPQVVSPSSTGWTQGTIADFYGVPTGVPSLSVSALPFRGYAMIMDQWFKNENTTDPVDYTVDDTTITGVNTGDQVTDCVKGGLPFKAAKYKDYFTSCLPGPQKGQSITLPLGDLAPIVGGKVNNLAPGYSQDNTFTGQHVAIIGNSSNTIVTDSSTPSGITGGTETSLYANMAAVTGTSVNQLRLAFQLQKLAELDARSGTRYIEKVRAHFSVISPDARMQRAEYLGGHRIRLNVNSVTQTSATGDTGTPQGHQAAYSVTADSHGDFSKSFTEHGYIHGIAVARYKHTYQQGLARHWSRKTTNQFYWPILANIGEEPVFVKEIYCTGNSSNDDAVFGYQEAWADYRHKPNRTTSMMRSTYSAPLDTWHLGDEYSSQPSLSSAWIQEDKTNVDRVLAVTSSVSNQLFGDFYFDVKATRVMPTFSVPGLIDHH